MERKEINWREAFLLGDNEGKKIAEYWLEETDVTTRELEVIFDKELLGNMYFRQSLVEEIGDKLKFKDDVGYSIDLEKGSLFIYELEHYD